ncbi:type II and III secretion system protein family protein [Falsirhodobacter sp. 20TX0035]|uniref:type II and III secretion system protein family protein n=1 Tax=Falsirhodobacter sp. 20TX0035 TaxID=3022019 RepID=UPI00232A7D89|nr:type II and III secretion system protein family protein [Falsirhodobacter sp. 20TX0035]MDB6454413.1 type II and III secretion system protein family protein [Falsirhodobacter sp. 20TX0035]
MKRRFGTAFLLLLLCLLPSVLHAQTLDARAGEMLRLSVGDGRILRFDAPVSQVFLADADIADVRVISPQMVYIHALRVGHSNLMAISEDEVTVGNVDLRVTENAGDLAADQRAAQPTSTISLRLFGSAPAASGQARDLQEALDTADVLEANAEGDEPVFNNTTMQGANQINIRVRFAEVSRDQLLRYGVSWNALSGGEFSFGLVTGTTPAAGSALLSASRTWSDGRIDVLLDALQQNGILTILAEPNITAVTGKTASFLAGGEVPIPVPVTENQVGIEYKQFGVSLLFTPTLLPTGRISMRVRPEVSSLSSEGMVEIANLQVPSLRVRRADTTVEVGSGQTFAIAGLFQRDASQSVDKVPLLGDVPILGQLFRSSRFQRNETELVILITPYLVQPVNERSLKTPLDSPSGTLSGPIAAANRPKTNAGFGFYVQ